MRNKYALKQTKDYNCGPTAVKYLIKSELSLDELEKELNCTEENGTSPESIRDYLTGKCSFINGYGYDVITTPMLVNYQYDGDGHYGVIVDVNGDKIKIFNPWLGRVETIKYDWFIKNWYSKRYGVKWGLTFLIK